LVKVQEVAEILGVKPMTVLKWVSQGRLPVVKISPRCLRFDLEAVLASLERFAVPAKEGERYAS
jgi:excisionase family DNA binding protein